MEAIGRLERPSVVCIGFFDGVHIGHARLVETAVMIARDEGLVPVVHTFDVMPARLLHPEACPEELTPLPEKARLLETLGAEIVAVSAFAEAMRRPGAEFFEQVLVGKLRARHIVAGFDHRFGYRGDTDVKALGALCANACVGLSVVEAVRLGSGELVSSTAIREKLARGEIAAAEAMLGRSVANGFR